MIALYIIAALLLLICLLLFWPVSTVIDFDSTDKAIGLYIRLLGIKIPITGKDKKQKKDKPKEKKPEKEKEKKENFLVTQLKEKFKHDGTANALRDLTGAAKNTFITNFIRQSKNTSTHITVIFYHISCIKTTKAR